MFGIASSEYLVILVVAILVLGPEHLPRVMRTAAKVMSNFRRITTELQRAINLESFESDLLSNKTTTSTKKKKTSAKKRSTAKKSSCQETPKKDVTPPANNQDVTISNDDTSTLIDKTTTCESNEKIRLTSLTKEESGNSTITTTVTSNSFLPKNPTAAHTVKKTPENIAVNDSVMNDCSNESSGAI